MTEEKKGRKSKLSPKKSVKPGINLKFIRTNVILSVLWIIMIFAALVAFPSVDTEISGKDFKYDGVDLTDVESWKFDYEFKFSPTLDFYGGSEFIYTLGDANGVKLPISSVAQAAKDLEDRLRNIGVKDYDIYVREGQEATEIVVRLPYDQDELLLFNQYLQYRGNVSLAVRAPQAAPVEGSEEAPAEQGFLPAPLNKDDIESISLHKGSETFGYGLAIKFKKSKIDTLLATAYSDINSGADAGLVLLIDENPIAAQSPYVPIYSNSTNGTVLFASGVGEDQLTARLLRDMIVNDHLNKSLVLNAEPNALEGRYDKYITPLLASFFIGLLLVVLLSIFVYKVKGLIASVNLLFVVLVSLAAFKILNLAINLPAIVGIVVALLVWGYAFRRVLRIAPLHGIVVTNWQKYSTNAAFITEYRNDKKGYFSNMLLLLVASIICSFAPIPAVVIAASYFVIVTFIAMFTVYFAFPISLNLLNLEKNAEATT